MSAHAKDSSSSSFDTTPVGGWKSSSSTNRGTMADFLRTVAMRALISVFQSAPFARAALKGRSFSRNRSVCVNFGGKRQIANSKSMTRVDDTVNSLVCGGCPVSEPRRQPAAAGTHSSAAAPTPAAAGSPTYCRVIDDAASFLLCSDLTGVRPGVLPASARAGDLRRLHTLRLRVRVSARCPTGLRPALSWGACAWWGYRTRCRAERAKKNVSVPRPHARRRTRPARGGTRR